MPRPLAPLTLALTLLLNTGVDLPLPVHGWGWNLPGSAQAAQTEQARQNMRVVILPFRNITGKAEDQWLSDSFAESLTMGLLKVESLQVIERGQIQQILKEQQFGQTGLVDEQSAPKLGRLMGAEVVVLGSYQKVGDELQANVRFVSVESGQIDRQRVAQVEGPFQDIFKLQKNLAHQLIQNLHVSASSKEMSGMEEVMGATDSTEAYRHYMQGLKTMREGLRDEEAIRDFHAALTADPDYALAYAGLAELHARKAHSHTQMLVLPPTQVFIQGPNDESLARDYADKALALQPDLPQAWRALAWLESAHGNRQRALELSRKAIKMNPRDTDSIVSYINLYSDNQSQSLQIEVLQKDLKEMGANFDDPWLKFTLASAALGQEMVKAQPDLDWIEKMLLDAQQDLPQYPYIPIELSGIQLRQGKFEQAQAYLKQAEAHTDDLPEVMGVIAEIYSSMKQNKQAMDLLDRALKLSPKAPNLLIAKAEALFASGQEDQAMALYQELEKQMPHNTWLALSQGSQYLTHGQNPKKAALYLERALKYWEQDPHGINRMLLANLLGTAYMIAGEYEKARPLFEEMRTDPVYYGQAYETLATLYSIEQKHAQALEAYTAYLTIHPEVRDDPRIQTNYKWYYLLKKWAEEPESVAVLNDLGQLATLRKAYSTAQKYLERGLELEPDNPVLHYNLGFLYLQEQKWPEATNEFQRATELKPDYLKAWYNLALAYRAQHQDNDAKAALRRVLELDSKHAEARQLLQELL